MLLCLTGSIFYLLEGQLWVLGGEFGVGIVLRIMASYGKIRLKSFAY